VVFVLKKSRPVFVYNKTRETFLAFRVKVAESVLGRLVGLLGRRSLRRDSGVWIVPGNAVHTIGLMFSVDLVLVDKNFKVVALRELVRPFTVTLPNFRAESVLELPAHSIFCSRTQIGDQLMIEPYEAKEALKGDAGGRNSSEELAAGFRAGTLWGLSGNFHNKAQGWSRVKYDLGTANLLAPDGRSVSNIRCNSISSR
jgi:uncharacterized membrane protein (UPF0127 family)